MMGAHYDFYLVGNGDPASKPDLVRSLLMCLQPFLEHTLGAFESAEISDYSNCPDYELEIDRDGSFSVALDHQDLGLVRTEYPERYEEINRQLPEPERRMYPLATSSVEDYTTIGIKEWLIMCTNPESGLGNAYFMWEEELPFWRLCFHIESASISSDSAVEQLLRDFWEAALECEPLFAFAGEETLVDLELLQAIRNEELASETLRRPYILRCADLWILGKNFLSSAIDESHVQKQLAIESGRFLLINSPMESTEYSRHPLQWPDGWIN